MVDRFADAYAERLSTYRQKVEQAHVEQRSITFSRPEATNREIERRELKRGVISLMTGAQLANLGASVLSPATDRVEPPEIDGTKLPAYARAVEFFERAFDWQNIAYTFGPYFFGRADSWNAMAGIEHDDPRHAQFLSAGSARVQVPIRRGYEAHVDHVFSGLGLFDLSTGVPWLASQQSIAEDLAAEARDGFELGVGRISITKGQRTVTGKATGFRPQDVDRELRIGQHIYIIRTVVSPTEVMIDGAANATASDAFYELGGIVVGPPIPVELPSTLVAIDIEKLDLPKFPPRYS
jgi:hypothetical protein